MPATARTWTRDDVLALPDDGQRHELIDGELLVSPSPSLRHQRAVWRLHLLVGQFVAANGLGLTGTAPADLALGGDHLVQPDLFVAEVAGEGTVPSQWADLAVPRLVVEVLSQSTARHDRVTKRRRYQQSGVAEYWIVDLDARLVERWRPGDERPEVVAGTIIWQPVPGCPSLTIDLEAWFAAADG